MKKTWRLCICFVWILWACSNEDNLTQKDAFLPQKILVEGSLFDSLSIDTTKYNQNKEIVKAIKKADSVFLISHTSYGIGADPIVKDHQINRDVLKEYLKISRKNRIRLMHILARNHKNGIISTSFCFEPHHAIIMFLNGKTSYVNLCFRCRNYLLSNKNEGYGDFDNQTWEELKTYFMSFGFKYELSRK